MDHLVEKLQWEPALEEGDVGELYPFDLQDEIHGIINEALEVKEWNLQNNYIYIYAV